MKALKALFYPCVAYILYFNCKASIMNDQSYVFMLKWLIVLKGVFLINSTLYLNARYHSQHLIGCW